MGVSASNLRISIGPGWWLIAVRHGLLLVDNFNRRHQIGEPPPELIRNGSLESPNAIFKTVLT